MSVVLHIYLPASYSNLWHTSWPFRVWRTGLSRASFSRLGAHTRICWNTVPANTRSSPHDDPL